MRHRGSAGGYAVQQLRDEHLRGAGGVLHAHIRPRARPGVDTEHRAALDGGGAGGGAALDGGGGGAALEGGGGGGDGIQATVVH